MQIGSVAISLVKASIALALVGGAAYSGYQYGADKVKEKCGQAFEVAFVDQALRESVEARHDRGIVELLNQQRTDDAFKLAQARYFSRILLLPELTKTSENQAIKRDIRNELIEAKSLSIQTSFKFSEQDLKSWEELVKTIPEQKKNDSVGIPTQQKTIMGIPFTHVRPTCRE